MEKVKRGRKDRRDGRFIHGMDGFHTFLPYLMPQRIGSEAFISEQVDLTNILAYLEEKNAAGQGKYTMFQVIAAAMIKTLFLRPHLNRFISGRRFYQRDEVSVAFVAKKQFADHGEEGLLLLSFDENATIDDVHQRIMAAVTVSRGGATGETMDAVNTFAKLPRFLLRIVMFILRRLDYHGKVPYDLIKDDPDFASVFISNLGSIGLNAGYHHLNDWGTNSLFLTIGKKQPLLFIDENGGLEVKPGLNLGITLDERLADGYYYSRSIRLLKHLLQNPALLELPAKEEVDYDC